VKILFELVVQDAGIAQKLELLRGNLKDINKELRQVDQDSKAFQSLTDEAVQTRIEIDKLVAQQKELSKEFKAATIPSDSLAGLRLEYSKLVTEITKLSKAERESEAGQKLIKNAAQLKNEINGIQESVGNFTGSVGNYRNSILSAADTLGQFGGTIGAQAGILSTAINLFDQGKTALSNFGQAAQEGFRNFKEGVSSFKEYLTSAKDLKKANEEVVESGTEVTDVVEETGKGGKAAGEGLKAGAKGAQLMSAAGTVLKGVLAALGIGLIIALVVGLIAVFQRFAPIVDFVEQAVDGLSAVFDVLVSRVARLVSAFGRLFSGDFSGAFDEASDAVSGMGSQMIEAAKSAAQLRKEMQDLEDAQKDFTLTTAKAEAAVAKLTVSLKDRTKSDAERLKIADQITKIETENLAKKTELIDRELEIERRRLLQTGQITEEQANQIAQGNFTLARQLEDEFKLQQDQADRIRELLVERVKAEGESSTLLERVQNRRNQIVEDAEKRREAAAQKAAQAAEKEARALEAQTNRIIELQKTIRELDVQTITSDFDRQEVEIQNKRTEALDKLVRQREEVKKKIAEQGGTQTAADSEELRLISEQTASIVAAYDLRLKEVRESRISAIDEQKRELEQLFTEVQVLAKQNAQAVAETQVDIINTDFSKQQSELASTLKERKLELTKQLEEGVISQKEFDEAFKSEQEAFNVQTLELERKRADEVRAIAEELSATRIDVAKSELSARLQTIEEATRAEVEAAKKEAVQTGEDPSVKIAELRKRAAEERAAAEQEYQDAVRQTVAETEQLQIDALDRVNEADQKVHDDKLARLKEEQELREELQKAALEAAGTIAGAIFEIERNKIEEEKNTKIQALDEETAKKREAAAGDADALAAIDKDYQKKKEAIEIEAAKKRKKTAIVEAIINTALAVVKALTGAAPPVSFVLAALAAIAGAAQIAVISSQKFAQGGALRLVSDQTGGQPTFAQGGAFRLLPSVPGRPVQRATFDDGVPYRTGTFGGRPHSRGGTKGYFEDGTRVEVEEDEIFVILNKRASKRIRQLSEFNYLHGGRKFEAGGTLDFTPQISAPGEAAGTVLAITTEATFSDDQVEAFANAVADKTATKTQSAVAAGLDDRNRTAEREAVLDSSREI